MDICEALPHTCQIDACVVTTSVRAVGQQKTTFAKNAMTLRSELKGSQLRGDRFPGKCVADNDIKGRASKRINDRARLTDSYFEDRRAWKIEGLARKACDLWRNLNNRMTR